ncbi:hypothetical protein ACWGVR_09895 [Streptomyces xanthophaeus]
MFDAYARFTAVIYEPYTMYAVLVMREGYVNRRFELNIGMAGTTQKICLHRA